MVMSYTQLLERDYHSSLDDKALSYIHYAVDGARRMQTLLHDMRDYWSVDQDNAAEGAPVNSQTVLENVLQLLLNQIQDADVVITHDPLPIVFSETYAVTLLFQNLLTNAIKFRRIETVSRVRISAYQDGKEWIFSFEDNGIGIDPEGLKEIFTPFKMLNGRSIRAVVLAWRCARGSWSRGEGGYGLSRRLGGARPSTSPCPPRE